MKLTTAICCDGINPTLTHIKNDIDKNCEFLYPVLKFISFVRTSSLWSVGVRKVVRESYYHFEVKNVLCTAPSPTTHIPSAIGLTRNYH